MLDASPHDLADAAAHAGFDYCGVRIVSPDDGSPLHGLIGDSEEQQRFLHRCRRLGVALLDTEAVWIRRETDLRLMGPLLDATAALGARYVLTVGFNDDREQLIDQLGTFADLAAERGLYLPLEFITYTAVPNLAEAWDVVQCVGRENVGVLIDALQFFRAGAEFDVLDLIPHQRIPYAQIADGPLLAPASIEGLRTEARTARILPGQGELDLPRLISALPVQIPLSVEAPTRALADRPFGDAARILHATMTRVLAKTPTTEGTMPNDG
ncbi:sugar phosphate isomerase/epimerase [Nocardioides immobilis]|uniref:Sugar phosphate isomerase/epimerase n=1 Tax=Nocardioides immobilis TaxID=2049295 RepID=A0A417Y8U0_9ACTN|nr:sugar phosphate isomerase/epimerase [Nocardioides immobilis]RHW29188.1 sugar phosphate isomerase/epimerase [Nocardioides immobilis]